jgi:F-type H+-transporting ATPase subunit b
MSINASLLGQMLTFAIFVWFCMKFIWPPLMRAIKERQEKIADGLTAADKGHRELEAAELRVVELLDEAKQHAAEILDGAQQRAHRVIDESKVKAREESARIIAQAQADIEQEVHAARQKLYTEISQLALVGAEKLIVRNLNQQDADKIMADLIAEVR